MNNWKISLPAFFILLFLIKYYDFFYIYLPVRSFTMGSDFDPTLASFSLYNYFFKVLFYLGKFLIVAGILSAGIFLEGKENKEKMASLGQLFLLAMTSEYILLAADLVKIIDYSFFFMHYTEQEYLHYYPLSLFSFLVADPDTPFATLLQVINVFEIGYTIFLAIGLSRFQYPEKTKAILVTLYSYGSMLAVWILIITYFKIV
jgi:hypothetical protein